MKHKLQVYNAAHNYFSEFDGQRKEENEPFRDVIK
jgi:hypothetical protein